MSECVTKKAGGTCRKTRKTVGQDVGEERREWHGRVQEMKEKCRERAGL